MKKTLDLFEAPPPPPPPPPLEAALGEAEAVEPFDDYDDGAHMHLVDPPPPAPVVIVEAVGENFEVSRLRDSGTTVACVIWTRTELEELVRRAQAALEMR